MKKTSVTSKRILAKAFSLFSLLEIRSDKIIQHFYVNFEYFDITEHKNV